MILEIQVFEMNVKFLKSYFLKNKELKKTRAGVCKTLCPQHLLVPKHGQILDFAQTFNR